MPNYQNLNQLNVQNLWYYRPFLIKNKLFCCIFIAIGVVNNIVTLLIPLSVGRFYELIFQSHSNKGFILDKLGLNFGSNFNSFIFSFLILILIKLIFSFLNGFLKDKIEEKFIADIRILSFRHQIEASFESHYQKAFAKYLGKFSADFGSIKKGLSLGILVFVADTLFSVFAVLFLAKVNFILTVILLFGLSILIVGLKLLENSRKALLFEKQSAKASYINFISERLQGFSTIKTFDRNQIEKKRFEKKAAIFSNSNLNYSYIRNLENALIPTGIYLTISVLLFTIFNLSSTSQSQLEAAASIAFVLLIFSIRSILNRFLKVKNRWLNAKIAIEKISKMVSEITKLPKLTFYEGNITFNHIGFGYDSTPKIIYNLSFEANKNEITLICGDSGSGKTTVLRLLAKLLKPLHGIIYLDGQDINQFSGVRKHLSIISDEFPLVGNNIYEAIVDVKNEENKSKAEEILFKLSKIFQLKSTISFQKNLINGGINLSQTERKVLVFARAILSEKPILLLDEPFANLNEQTVHFLGGYINELKENKTIILVSSRNCSSIHYDRIVDLGGLFKERQIAMNYA